MPTGERASELIRLVEDELARIGDDRPDDIAPLAEAMRYSLLAGGKRLRPLLCLAVCDAVGGSAEAALPTALALELVHTFSLVHDDLPALDDDDLRRGRPTAHVQFGEDIAILSGDALLAEAFGLIVRSPGVPGELLVAAVDELSRGVGLAGMIGGQYLDITGATDLERTSRLKTGALIAASCACGAIVGGADPGQVASARRFGVELGLLFQIVDDILDETGTDDQLGKRAGADVRRGRHTFASELGVDGARGRAAIAEAGAREALAGLAGPTELLAELVDRVARRDR